MLPFEGDEIGLIIALSDEVDEMLSSIGASAYLDLFGDLIAEFFERSLDELFKFLSRGRVPRKIFGGF